MRVYLRKSNFIYIVDDLDKLWYCITTRNGGYTKKGTGHGTVMPNWITGVLF